jgi:CheY-like chemotaxis protein
MNQTTVLIVEDEPALRDIYQRVMQKQAWHVCEARDGEEALAFLQDTTPDLIFLDMLLPHVSGLQVLQYLASQPHLHRAHVVIISSSQEYARYTSLLPSCEFYLKPILPSKIQEIILRFSEKLPR